MTEPQNKTADLSGLRIDREEPRSPRRFLYPVVATAAHLAQPRPPRRRAPHAAESAPNVTPETSAVAAFSGFER